MVISIEKQWNLKFIWEREISKKREKSRLKKSWVKDSMCFVKLDVLKMST